MANYVLNKVICSKSFFEEYFLDPYSIGEQSYEYCKEEKYISFNKLYGVKDVNEYSEKYGEYIDYGHFYTMKELDCNLVEVKFKTRHYYPICAIIKSIELDHTVVWYAFEENIVYISKFMWMDGKVIEKVLDLGTDDFDKWYDQNVMFGDTYEDLDSADDNVWYYDYDNKTGWKVWDSENLIKRYKDIYSTTEYFEWLKNT